MPGSSPVSSSCLPIKRLLNVLLSASLLAAAQAQHAASPPTVVQPGAPGQPSTTLPSSARPILPPNSPGDTAFMQGMIMHHSQAVEMTALIPSHSEDKDILALGARIGSSQTDEMKFMQRWLAGRGEPASMSMPDMPGMDMSGQPMPPMPGMLSAAQMQKLRESHGAQFDRLFLAGMIQHHNGALTMVKELFRTPGAGQDADLFNFATDADNTQRAEIVIMQTMQKNKQFQEKP